MKSENTVQLTLGLISIACAVLAIALVLTKPGSKPQPLTVQTTNTIETTNGATP